MHSIIMIFLYIHCTGPKIYFLLNCLVGLYLYKHFTCARSIVVDNHVHSLLPEFTAVTASVWNLKY